MEIRAKGPYRLKHPNGYGCRIDEIRKNDDGIGIAKGVVPQIIEGDVYWYVDGGEVIGHPKDFDIREDN